MSDYDIDNVSPRPWAAKTFCGTTHITEVKYWEYTIAMLDIPLKTQRLPEKRIEANAHHIVKCVNMHDELVDALETIIKDDCYFGDVIIGESTIKQLVDRAKGGNDGQSNKTES